jgi:sugar-specific transcriptional regulator TrmB
VKAKKEASWRIAVSLMEHAEKVLRELGLTFSQAKLYVALLRLSDGATASAIGSFANVARQDVYHLMDELQEIGLVEKIVSNPTKYKAVPIEEVTSVLLGKRRDRTQALIEESAELFSKFPGKSSKTEIHEITQFMLIPKGETLVRKVEKTLKAAQKQIFVVMPWREFTQWIFALQELWQQTLDRGVRMHWLTENPPQNSDANMEMIDNFMHNPMFKLRTLPPPIDVRLSVFDSREVFIAINTTINAAESPALWTNSPTMVSTLEDYFRMKWEIATEYRRKER